MAEAAGNRHAAAEGMVGGQDTMVEEDFEPVVAVGQGYLLISEPD